MSLLRFFIESRIADAKAAFTGYHTVYTLPWYQQQQQQQRRRSRTGADGDDGVRDEKRKVTTASHTDVTFPNIDFYSSPAASCQNDTSGIVRTTKLTIAIQPPLHVQAPPRHLPLPGDPRIRRRGNVALRSLGRDSLPRRLPSPWPSHLSARTAATASRPTATSR